MDMTQLQNIKTYALQSKEDIVAAVRLSKYYNYRPIYAKRIDKLLKADWWVGADLLTDVVHLGKINELHRLPVAFLLLEEVNIRNASTDPVTDLQVSCFAVDAWYDQEVAVNWADYRITQYCDLLSRIDKVLWYVHERNVPVQIYLRELGYHAMGGTDPRDEMITFTK